MIRWDIITGEYPPQPGGVSDYTRSVACGLAAAGDRVHVWAPPYQGVDVFDGEVTVHRLPDHFRWCGLRFLNSALAVRPDGGRILLQYVPHAFGWKAMNVPFCLWLVMKAPGKVWVVCHEVAVQMAWRNPVKTNIIAVATRFMSVLVAGAAERIWVTIPAWKTMLAKVAPSSTPIECLPVPSTIQIFDDPRAVQSIRQSLLSNAAPFLLGHFGTYRQENGCLLMNVIPSLMTACASHFLLLGQHSNEFRRQLIAQHPHLQDRVSASGALSSKDLSVHLAACDVMVQPYPDGVSGRRTSMMACLAHALPVITNQGAGSEDYWAKSGAVSIVANRQNTDFAFKVRALLTDAPARRRLSKKALSFYEERFSLAHVIEALRSAAAAEEFGMSDAVVCQASRRL